MYTYTLNTPKTEELQVQDQPELYNKIQYQIKKNSFRWQMLCCILSQLYTQEKIIINLNDQQREKN